MRAAGGEIRPPYQAFAGWLERTPADRIAQKREEAERAFHRVGITFAVYGEEAGTERLIPFDLVPRIISGDEWKILDRGLKQRVQAGGPSPRQKSGNITSANTQMALAA